MIYLDNGATSFPKPEAVYARVDFVMRNVGGSPGRASHRMAVEADRIVFRAREALSRLLGVANPERLALTRNATESLNIALKGLLNPGDHLVTTAFEHNSVARPVRRLEIERGVMVTRIKGKDGLVTADDVRGAIRADTRMVCVTHASNVFGTITPAQEIAEVCRAAGVLFMLDAAQTAGAMPIDAASLGADAIAGTGHKALFGPQGTGFLYLRDGLDPAPLIDGGTGDAGDLLPIPERLEAGTMNMPGISGLAAGVEFILETGQGRIREKEASHTARLIEGLSGMDGVRILGPLDAAARVPLVSFTIDGMAARRVGIELDERYSIMVRTGTQCAPDAHRVAGTHPDGTIRVSPGFFNTDEDIETFLTAIESIMARRGNEGKGA